MMASFGRRQDCNLLFLAGVHIIMRYIMTGDNIILCIFWPVSSL